MKDDPFETSDAAYVLGALSADERRDFEEHLLTCDDCAGRVADLQHLPGSLALAPEEAFGAGSPGATDTSGSDAPLPDLILPRLLQRVSRERRRRRLIGIGSAVVAAACVIALVTVVLTGQDTEPDAAPKNAAVMANLLDVPITARADVVTVNDWARVDLWCTYRAGTYSQGSYRLVAVSRSGQKLELGTWPGIPGQTAVMRIPTQWHTADIASIQILGGSGRVVSQLTR